VPHSGLWNSIQADALILSRSREWVVYGSGGSAVYAYGLK
jgi:hypothetical protein